MIKNKKCSSQDLISMALYQLLQTNSYDDISIKDICNKAGVSRMSFYRSYSKKDDIFLNFCDQKFAEFFSNVKLEENITGYDFVLSLFRFLKRFERQLYITKMANKLDLLRDHFSNYWSFIISKAQKNDIDLLKVNPLTIPFISGGSFNILVHWIDSGFKETPEQMAEWSIHIMD